MQKVKARPWREIPIPTAAIAKLGRDLTPEEQLEMAAFRDEWCSVDWEKEFETMTAGEADLILSINKFLQLAMENHNAQVELE